MADEFTIKRAVPTPEFARVGIAGPSSSGKTVSALRLAIGLLHGTGKRVTIIDTENKRALKYAKHFDFDHIDFQPPFTAERYLTALQRAVAQGAGAIIIDSMSHEHEGPGGALEQHEAFLQKRVPDGDYKKRDKLNFTAWIGPKSERNRLIQMGIQRVNAHLILCFRAKEKLKIKPGANPENLGWTPIGGDEFPFEMLTNIILPPKSAGKPDWNAEASTINSLDKPLIDLLRAIEQISQRTGAEFARLLGTAPPPVDKATTSTPAAAGQGQASTSQPATTSAAPPPLTEHDRAANKVKAAIKTSPDSTDMEQLWNHDYAPEIDLLRREKPEYLKRLEQLRDERLQAIAAPPPAGDEFPGDRP